MAFVNQKKLSELEPFRALHYSLCHFIIIDWGPSMCEAICCREPYRYMDLGWWGETHHSVGKITDIESDGLLMIDIPSRPSPWQADPSDMEKVENFKVGDWVRVKASVPSPKYGWEDVTCETALGPSGWSNETAASIGTIARIDMDGTLNVRVAGKSSLWKVAPGDAKDFQVLRLEIGVRLKPSLRNRHIYDWNSVGKESIAVVHSIQD
ncbi:hypothetical protein J5N97_000444 [Dioscorea zingiberensis]|uniref:Mind bomb SH3 repeat domain-containing protein n=1 Tax=Dioscorea zingiberensis TaxID=325984 RepID=A0A9D5BSF4_9LILI|nr:hypothetical protein J5N97_000444 [Dioscorea zingiberensis]